MDCHVQRTARSAHAAARVLALVSAMLLTASAVAAQPALERVVGDERDNNPFVLDAIDAHLATALSLATKQPIAFEFVAGENLNVLHTQRHRPGVRLTGMTLLEALRTHIIRSPLRVARRERHGRRPPLQRME
jgi:hypothetical protein